MVSYTVVLVPMYTIFCAPDLIEDGMKVLVLVDAPVCCVLAPGAGAPPSELPWRHGLDGAAESSLRSVDDADVDTVVGSTTVVFFVAPPNRDTGRSQCPLFDLAI